ncbi:MAG: hypothetical protein N2422_01990 [Rhodobacteraceae bacterium]|nr:hypothetical protein [Paracoccaceae bacterium]
MAVQTVDQKVAFQERLKRINAGRQYEPEDVIGHRTQKSFNRRYGTKPRRRRSFADILMLPIAFLSGIVAVFGGRFLYFHLAQMEGMPEAFVNLGGRGMLIFALVLAGILTVVFHLSTRPRMQALALGCLLMHFGESAMASNAPELWAEMFSPDYAAELAAQGAGFRLTPAAG